MDASSTSMQRWLILRTMVFASWRIWFVNVVHDRGVYAWNGRGRIRFSFHGFNAMPDVDRIMATLEAEWRG
jgi:hypothetical protein